MGRLWMLITHVHALAGPVTMLLYPLYASVMAIESPSKVDDEQWLADWILCSFLTLTEMLLQPILQWIPIWYDIKLAFVAWLALPQFRGAAVIYERFVRETQEIWSNRSSPQVSQWQEQGQEQVCGLYYPQGRRARGLLKKKGEDSTLFSLKACLDFLVSNITPLLCFGLLY